MLNVCTWSGCVNPGSTPRSAWKLRIINPAPTSSTSASAICAATSTCCERCCSRVRLAPRRRPQSTSRGLACFRIGMNPKSNPERSATTSAKPSTTGSTAISCSRGRFDGPTATSARTPSRPGRPPVRRPPAPAGGSRPAAAGQALPAGTQRRANRQLLPAGLGAHQQQVRDVGAGQAAGRRRSPPSAPRASRRRRRRRPVRVDAAPAPTA